MIKTVNTSCSRGTLAIDAALTAIGWLGFLYLLGQGVLTLVNRPGHTLNHSLMTAMLPIVLTLLIYVTIAAFNALLLVVWATYCRSHSRSVRRQATSALDDNTLAAHFSLSRHELHQVQDSRVTIIHLSDGGGITHLETDQLHAEPESADNQAQEVAQAA